MVEIFPVALNKTKRRKIVSSFDDSPKPGEYYVLEKGEIREVGRVLPRGEGSESSARWRVVREAVEYDLLQAELNKKEASQALPVAQRLAEKRSLPMKIIGSEYSFQKSKLTFYFKAPHRIDFRGLVKSLAKKFSTRIELEQVGPRDAASILGGRGRCGREFCCRRFLYDPGPVPMDVAEKQDISVSPERITGGCGRLACCLQYELEDYIEKLEEMPAQGTRVDSPKGEGKVLKRNVQKESLRVQLEEKVEEFSVENVDVIEKDNRED